MAEESRPPSVTYRHNVADGVHEIGVTIDGAFVAFASRSDAYAAQLVENAKNRSAAAEAAKGESE